jgi:hypothetical protein
LLLLLLLLLWLSRNIATSLLLGCRLLRLIFHGFFFPELFPLRSGCDYFC